MGASTPARPDLVAIKKDLRVGVGLAVKREKTSDLYLVRITGVIGHKNLIHGSRNEATLATPAADTELSAPFPRSVLDRKKPD